MRRVDVLRGWRDRWNVVEVKQVARQLTAELLAGDVRTASPFGLVDGRVDLRGLQVDLLATAPEQMYRRVTVTGGRWDGLDLTGAGLSGMNWFRLRVGNCVLDDAQLDDLRCWGVHVADTLAHRASLRFAQIGAPVDGYERSSWRRVDLKGADVRRLHGNVDLEDVDLSNAKFGQTALGWSNLKGVHFQGLVKGLSIGDLGQDLRPAAWTISEVDLSRATLRGLDLLTVDLGTPEVDIRLPDGEEQWIVRDWAAFLDRLRAYAPEELRPEVDVWVDHERRRLGPRQTWGFVSLHDASEYAGQPFVALLRSTR